MFLFSPSNIASLILSLFFPLALYWIALFSVLQSHHHEEEKRALRGEIIVLNNHLMEAKITINKLREDNVSARLPCLAQAATNLNFNSVSRHPRMLSDQ